MPDTTYPAKRAYHRASDGAFVVPSGATLAFESGSLQTGGVPNAAGGPFQCPLFAYRADYSFASQGGTVGTIGLSGATGIPANAVILGGYLRVTTGVTGGASATAAIQIEGANDTINAAAVTGAPWSTTGFKSLIETFAGANCVLTTAARDISLVIGTAALTAGAFSVVVFYTVIA